MLLQLFDLILAKDLAPVICFCEDQTFACLVMCLGYHSVFTQKSFTLQFRFCWLLKQYVFDCTRNRAYWEKRNLKNWDILSMVPCQVFHFFPPKTFKPNKQTTWNTSHLHGIAWSSGKLDYEALFVVFYDIMVMNAEVFAEGLEKCGLLTRLVRKNLENLDDYGCPKLQDLVGEGIADSPWICSSYLFRHKTGLDCAERKAKLYGDWARHYV